MLDAADLAALRATVAQSLVESVAIRRATRLADGRGGSRESWALVATVPGRRAPRDVAPDVPLVAGQPVPGAVWVLTLPWDAPVQVGDQLEVGGQAYRALAVRAPRTDALQTRVLAVEA